MGSWSSYKEANKEYKYSKAIPLNDLPIPYKKKKKKHHKKSDHKHEYIAAIFYAKNSKSIIGSPVNCGFVCKHCGRIEEVHFLWNRYLETIKQFELDHPDFIEIYLPENWNWFTNKYIPFGE